MRIAVIGAGSWGTALANLLAGKGEEVTLWAYEADLVERLRIARTLIAAAAPPPITTRTVP